MRSGRRREAFDAMFEIFVKEGRELTLLEMRTMYPYETADLRKQFQSNLGSAVRRMRRIYADRWHEIYDTKLGVVHEAPKPAPKPVEVEEKVEEPSKKLTPLEILRGKAGTWEGEHE